MKDALKITLIDIVAELESHDLEYALVGGLAASLRGRVRVTDDVDLVVRFDVYQALNFAERLNPEKFAGFIPDVESVARSAFLLPLVHKQSGIQLDLAIGVSGFEEQIVSRATKLTIANRRVPVATAEDLVLMKLLAGRPQDNQDIRGIVATVGLTLDWDYLLSVAEQLDQALALDLSTRIRSLKEDVR